MGSDKKLIVPRATRIDEDIARVLMEITDSEGLKPAEVDRQILTWFAESVARIKPASQGLRHFLRSLRLEPA